MSNQQCKRAHWYSFHWISGEEICGESTLDNRPPQRLHETASTQPDCLLCAHVALCHGPALAQVNCRTCAHSTASSTGWLCEHHHKPISIAAQRAACPGHVYHPDLLESHEPISANPKTGSITFRRIDGTKVEIGLGGTSTGQLLAESIAAIDDEVLAELAQLSTVPAETLLAGQLDEVNGWPKLTSSVCQFWDRWNHDDARMARLRALIAKIDMAYCKGVA